MLGGQSSFANEKPALPLQVETDEVVLSWNVASRRSTRLRWTGCCFAVLMLFGGSASQIFPIASHVSAKPSHHIATAAFSPSLRLPVVDARGDRPAVTGLRKPGSKKLNLRRPMSGPRMGGSAGEPSDESKDSQFSRRSFTQLLGISPVGLPGIAGAQDIINNAKEPEKQPVLKVLLEAGAAKLNANKAATDSIGAAIKDGYLKATADGEGISSIRAPLQMLGPYPLLSVRFPDIAAPESVKEQQKANGETGIRLDMIVDTGSSVNTINVQLVKELGLTAVSTQEAGVSAAGALGISNNYALGTVQLNDLPQKDRFPLMNDLIVSAIPVAAPPGIGGILGLGFLLSFAGGIEFVWGDAASGPSARLPAPGPVASLNLYANPKDSAGLSTSMEEVPARQLDAAGGGLLILTMVVNGVKIPALLDTGSPATILNAAAAKLAGIELPAEPDQSSMNLIAKAKVAYDQAAAMASGEVVYVAGEKGPVALRKTPNATPISLGGAVIRDVRPYVGEIPGLAALPGLAAEGAPAAILGTDVLRRRKSLLILPAIDKVFV